MCLIDIAIKLVGGSSFNEGRVEVNYNGEWGTVCDDGWGYYSTRVVCRQLGLGTYGYITYNFGQGSGPIWLDNVICTGSESTIASCGHLGFNVTRSCGHYEDVRIVCYGTQGKNFTINKITYSMHTSFSKGLRMQSTFIYKTVLCMC